MNEIKTVWEAIHPTVVALGLSGGAFVAIASQLLKKWFGLNSEKVIYFMVMLLGVFGSVIQFLLTSKGQLPVSVLGVHTATVLGVAQPLYLYIIKPADNFLKDVQDFRGSKATAKQVAADAQVAAVDPPASLAVEEPVATITPETPATPPVEATF